MNKEVSAPETGNWRNRGIRDREGNEGQSVISGVDQRKTHNWGKSRDTLLWKPTVTAENGPAHHHCPQGSAGRKRWWRCSLPTSSNTTWAPSLLTGHLWTNTEGISEQGWGMFPAASSAGWWQGVHKVGANIPANTCLEREIPLALRIASLPPGTFPRPLGVWAPPSQALTLTHIHLLLLTQFNLHHLTNHLWIWPPVQFTSNEQTNVLGYKCSDHSSLSLLRGLLWFVAVLKFSSVQQQRADNFLKFLKF